MPNPATTREQRRRRTKAQLIDEIDSFERRVAVLEVGEDWSASGGGKPSSNDDYLANQALLDLAKFPSENPNPVLRVTPEGGLLYANDAAQTVNGLLTGRKKDRLPSRLAKVATEVSRTGAAQEPEFHSGDHIYALALTPVAGEPYINISGRDVTEQRELEDRIRQITENIGEVFWLTDPKKMRMLYISPAYESIWGNSCESLLQNPQSFLDAIHDEDRDRIIAALEKQPRGDYDEEYRIVRPDGGVRWIRDRAFPVKDGSGRVHRVAGIAADITELKRREQELAEKEALLRVALDNMPGGMMLGDRDFNYVLFNAQYSELCEYPTASSEPAILFATSCAFRPNAAMVDRAG